MRSYHAPGLKEAGMVGLPTKKSVDIPDSLGKFAEKKSDSDMMREFLLPNSAPSNGFTPPDASGTSNVPDVILEEIA